MHHPVIPHNPNPLDIANHAERLGRERKGDNMALVFSAITAISLGVVTTKAIFDMYRESRERPRSHGRER